MSFILFFKCIFILALVVLIMLCDFSRLAAEFVLHFNYWQQNTYLSSIRLFVGDATCPLRLTKMGVYCSPRNLQKYGMHEATRFIITEFNGRICLVPVKTYDRPTEALYGPV